jgi:hypothetical protein
MQYCKYMLKCDNFVFKACCHAQFLQVFIA